MLELQVIMRTLNRRKVRYLLAGGLAGVLHGVPRTTVDVDIMIFPGPENVSAAVKALESLGLVPDTDVVKDILGMGGTTFTNDREVDIITNPALGSFDELWKRRQTFSYKGVKIPVISLDDHRAILRKLRRKQDIEDLKFLRER